MDAPLSPINPRPRNPETNPFLTDHARNDFHQQHARWPWIVIALLTGVGLAALVTHWEKLPFLKPNASLKDPSLVPTALSSIIVKKMDIDEAVGNLNDPKGADTIVQVDRRGSLLKQLDSTPEKARHILPLNLEQQPKPSSPELTLQTSIVRLPPLSLLKIYFPKPYREAPAVKLTGEINMPNEVTIEEITVQYVVIRNAHVTNDCYFRYIAEGKLNEAARTSGRLP